MQIVSNGDNLHYMSNPVFLEKNKVYIINLSSAEKDSGILMIKSSKSNLKFL